MRKISRYKYQFLFPATFAAITILIGCKGIFSSDEGNTVRKEINLDDFSNIEIDGIFNIVLKQDTVYKLTLEGAEDFINDIDARVKDGTLIIEDRHQDLFRIEEIPDLYLHFKDIRYLWTFSPVKISCEDTLKLDWFYFYPVGEIGEAELTVQCNFFGMDNSANTLGRFFIRGMAQTAKFYNRYGSSVHADSLTSRVVHVYNESVGDVYVYADDLLEVFIWGPGNIYYTGDPDVQIMEKRSSGQVLKL